MGTSVGQIWREVGIYLFDITNNLEIQNFLSAIVNI